MKMINFVREDSRFGFRWNDYPLISANWQGWVVVTAVVAWILI